MKTKIRGENPDAKNNQGKTKVPALDVQQQETQQNTELRVYSRRKNQQTAPAPETCHESNPESGNSHTLSMDNSDDLPIALRKGVRSCTQHPIAHVAKYDHLTPSVIALVSNLENEEIPKNIQEALKRPEWKKAVEEEMKALEKNGT